jgi:hypothetical protein
MFPKIFITLHYTVKALTKNDVENASDTDKQLTLAALGVVTQIEAMLFVECSKGK